MVSMSSLTFRVALVTGGDQGIAKAIAPGFVETEMAARYFGEDDDLC